MVYGGKVLDNFDRRILFAYLDEYLGDFVFDSFQPFHFYKGHQTNYTIPYAANSKMDFLRKFSHTISVALYVFSIFQCMHTVCTLCLFFWERACWFDSIRSVFGFWMTQKIHKSVIRTNTWIKLKRNSQWIQNVSRTNVFIVPSSLANGFT